jgi:hypothetical protein
MIMGTHQRVFKEVYYCPDSVHTIVPGILFDNDEYCFLGKDRNMSILLRAENDADEILVSYPRDLTISPDTRYSSEFLADLGPKSTRGSRAHAIYPIPDSAFVWNRPLANVATRSSSIKMDAKAHESKDGIAHEHVIESSIDHDHADDINSTDTPGDESGKKTTVSLDPKAQSFEPVEGEKKKRVKQITKAKSLDLLAHYHEARGLSGPPSCMSSR